MERFEDEATAGLRQWARGMLSLEAATEMMIRGGWAEANRPWVKHDTSQDRWWIDFAAIPDLIGGFSGGQKRFLRLATSIAGELEVRLDDELAGLDRTYAELVLAAVAHTAGITMVTAGVEMDGAGGVRLVGDPKLHRWPDSASIG